MARARDGRGVYTNKRPSKGDAFASLGLS